MEHDEQEQNKTATLRGGTRIVAAQGLLLVKFAIPTDRADDPDRRG
jgi:hypothetical protein